MLLLDAVEQLQPIEAAALQPDIQEYEVRPARPDRGDGRIAIARRAGRVSLVLQKASDQFADVGFVVDDQDIGRHDYRAAFCKAGSVAGTVVTSGLKRMRTQAPRAPGSLSDASYNSMPPPCSSRIRPTIANPSPVPFS